MTVDKFGADDVIGQGSDEQLRLGVRHIGYTGAVIAHHVKALASGVGMRAKHRVHDLRKGVNLGLRNRVLAFSSGKIEHRPQA